MSSLFTNLKIKKIIVHEVFKLNENREIIEPRFSNHLSNLDSKGLNTLQERIIEALGNDSHCIEMYVSNADPNSTFDISTKLLNSDSDEFIHLSKEIPIKLTRAQTSRKIPGGTVVVFSGEIGIQNYRFLGIIKAEIHGGFSLYVEDDRLLLKYLSDLLLTPQQKLYKIGMFIEKQQNKLIDTVRDPSDFIVYVYDHNLTRNETQTAAQYFYQSFLGCSISPSDKKLTRDFFSNTKEFIESLNIDEENKLDLVSGLYTYLKVDQSNVILAHEFATRYLPQDSRDNYINYLEEKGIPLHGIHKDLSYLKYKLRKRKLVFSSDVRILAPADDFDELVQILDTKNNRTTLSIKGKIEKEL